MSCKDIGDNPFVWIHESEDYAYKDLGESFMEFRLTYQGPLLADRGKDNERQSRVKLMHTMRRQFHEQLSELWRLDGRLKHIGAGFIETEDVSTGVKTKVSGLDEIAQRYGRDGIRWVPLVAEHAGVACGLNILFLRHEPKGGIIQSGDLDNRINTLFDALRIPDKKQIPDDVDPQKEPAPFYCLLSNDKLIAEFRVTADRLLVPSAVPQGDSDVHLVIEVRTYITDHEKARWSLLATPHMLQ
jgi:hypothetical protein